jgi:hypothetical protein
MEAKIYIPSSITKNLPAMVRNELSRLSAQHQQEFVEEYRRKAKSVGGAYVLWLVLGCHYAYVGKWGVQALFWLTFGGVCFWWVVDAFRVPGMVGSYNKDVAVEVLRNLKAVSGSREAA